MSRTRRRSKRNNQRTTHRGSGKMENMKMEPISVEKTKHGKYKNGKYKNQKYKRKHIITMLRRTRAYLKSWQAIKTTKPQREVDPRQYRRVTRGKEP